MQNGLYSARFETPSGTSNGIVILRAGHINGGDGSLYYFGLYTVDGNSFKARAKTGRHTPDRVQRPIFGRQVVIIEMSGSFDRNIVTGVGKTVDPAMKFTLEFKLISRNV
jgi:T3SS negative regulator,GrlR